jgi:replicative DNA helicase
MEFKNGLNYSIELERAILGICVLLNNGFGRVYSLIEKDCFYNTANQVVFENLAEMYKSGLPIDIFTVADYIRRVKGIEMLDGYTPYYYITKLTNDVVNDTHLEYHCFVVKTMWMEREIVGLTHGSLGKLEGSISQQVKVVQDKLYSLQTKAAEHDWTDMTQLMVDLYQHQEEMKKTGGVGVITGISVIDKENGGFQNGQLVVIGARPSVGKSAFAGGIAVEMAKKNKTIGFVSLEMSNTEIAARLAAYDTDTDFNVVYRGLYKDMNDAHRLYERIANSTSTLPIYVSDKTKVSVPEIRAKADKLKSMHGLDCLFIDYLQLVNSGGNGSYTKNRENEIAEMSRGCKIMAKELNIPVILLCQLNREVTKRTGDDRYPKLSDLRESGAIEQDADVVMFLHSDFMSGIEIDENGNSTQNQSDLVIRKWRNGRSNFIVNLEFDRPKMKFSEKNSLPQISYPGMRQIEDKDSEIPF